MQKFLRFSDDDSSKNEKSLFRYYGKIELLRMFAQMFHTLGGVRIRISE